MEATGNASIAGSSDAAAVEIFNTRRLKAITSRSRRPTSRRQDVARLLAAGVFAGSWRQTRRRMLRRRVARRARLVVHRTR
jgi:hypothetical protein